MGSRCRRTKDGQKARLHIWMQAVEWRCAACSCRRSPTAAKRERLRARLADSRTRPLRGSELCCLTRDVLFGVRRGGNNGGCSTTHPRHDQTNGAVQRRAGLWTRMHGHAVPRQRRRCAGGCGGDGEEVWGCVETACIALANHVAAADAWQTKP
jgi:hypothetical protein